MKLHLNKTGVYLLRLKNNNALKVQTIRIFAYVYYYSLILLNIIFNFPGIPGALAKAVYLYNLFPSADYVNAFYIGEHLLLWL